MKQFNISQSPILLGGIGVTLALAVISIAAPANKVIKRQQKRAPINLEALFEFKVWV